VKAGHRASALGEPDPFQIRGDTWIRVMGGRIQSFRNGRWLSRGKYVLVTHISNHSGADPLVITPWLINQNRDLETSLGLLNPRAGPQLRAQFCVNPTWTIDQHYTAPLTPGRHKGVT